MSDIHSITTLVVDDLIRKKAIDNNTIVITTGDMEGDFSTGVMQIHMMIMLRLIVLLRPSTLFKEIMILKTTNAKS